jgi:hypothetical protein
MFQNIKKKGLGTSVALAGAGVVFATMVGASSSASASVLIPGGSVVPSSLAILPAGDALVATETNPFTGLDSFSNVKFTGELTSSVYTNPNTGGLDFLYQVTNDNTSADSFDELSVKSYAGFTTDADFVSGTGSVDPTSATRSADAPGKLVSFFFNSGVPHGQNTSELLVETNSMNYMTGVGSVIDGGTGGSVVEAPAVGTLMSNVPEPASFSAILIGGGMLLGRRRR